MDLKQITNMQVEMDQRHGFPVQFATPRETYQQLTKDLVGLFGEIGEFSNVVKKINIKLDQPENYNLIISDAEELLAEELADSLIYILRISAILGIDLEKETLNKMRSNDARYAQLRQK